MDQRRKKRGLSLYRGKLYPVPLGVMLAVFIVMMLGKCGYLGF
ncbi:MAG TPA: hypothetical protein VIB98_10145 [Gemmatimonadaceae bacterium]|jgi:hypothetical protein